MVLLAAVPQFRNVTLVQDKIPHVQQAQPPQERLGFGEATAQAILFLPDDEGSVGWMGRSLGFALYVRK